jgi:hypothetical protein
MLVFAKMNEAAGTQKIWPLLLLLLLGAGLIIESNGPACAALHFMDGPRTGTKVLNNRI